MNTSPENNQRHYREKAKAVLARLEETYGQPAWHTPQPALDEIVSTILSQNTNDRNRDAAFYNLKNRFPTWEAVRDAPLAEVVNSIHSAGLSNQKGARIQEILREITRQRGSLNLDFLKAWPPDKVSAWLLSFKGIGPKTAAIVMVFSLGMPAFPVDTHIYRVSGRLGLRPADASVEKTHEILANWFDPAQYGSGHLNLIRLGREICTARKPRCPECPLLDLCPYGQGGVQT